MKGAKTKNIIRIICVVLLTVAAFFIAFVLMPKLYRMEGATTEVLMLRQSVERGTQIDATMVATVTVGAYGLDSSVLKDANAIIGKYADTDISYKDLLYAEKFVAEDPLADVAPGDLEVELKENEMLLTLALSSTAAGAAGNILPGDAVNVAVFIDNPEDYNFGSTASTETEPTANADTKEFMVLFPDELQNLIVYRMLTSELVAVNPGTDDNVPVYITLICTQEQANALLEYSYASTIHFVEVN